jgi:hypothetical protein
MGTSLRAELKPRVERALDALEARLMGGPLAPTARRVIDDDGHAMLVLDVHPAAEPLRFVDLGSTLTVEVMTGTAGPGFHQHVVDLLERTGDLVDVLVVEDSSGYWEARDRRTLERASDIWLRGMAMEVLALHARGLRGLQLSLPEGAVFMHDEAVATALGPRSLAWLEVAAKTPASARDVFAWWDEGVGAAALEGAARVAMWIDQRWRAPINDAERALGSRILGWLEAGHALDPEREWPWAEWSELYEAMGVDSLAATRVHLRASGKRPAIGYRRRPVRTLLGGGWSIAVPGDFADQWDERGTYNAWDGSRSLFVTTVTARDSNRSTAATLSDLPPLNGDGNLLSYEQDHLMAIARFGESEEDGHPLRTLSAHAASGPHAAIGTVTFERETDRDWALELWSSLAHEK